MPESSQPQPDLQSEVGDKVHSGGHSDVGVPVATQLGHKEESTNMAAHGHAGIWGAHSGPGGSISDTHWFWSLTGWLVACSLLTVIAVRRVYPNRSR